MAVSKEVAEKYWLHIKPYIIEKRVSYIGDNPGVGSYKYLIDFLYRQKQLFIEACTKYDISEAMLKDIFDDIILTEQSDKSQVKKFI